MEQTELTRVGDPARNAIRIGGFIGSVGGRIPQQFVTYLMREGGMYYTFTLYALGRDSEIERVDVIWSLGEADIVAFDVTYLAPSVNVTPPQVRLVLHRRRVPGLLSARWIRPVDRIP
jgi:hypothetical protein